VTQEASQTIQGAQLWRKKRRLMWCLMLNLLFGGLLWGTVIALVAKMWRADSNCMPNELSHHCSSNDKSRLPPLWGNEIKRVE